MWLERKIKPDMLQLIECEILNKKGRIINIQGYFKISRLLIDDGRREIKKEWIRKYNGDYIKDTIKWSKVLQWRYLGEEIID